MATVIVAAAVIERAGRILLTQRKKDGHLAGYWEFPGGKVEAGEDPERTVVRECLEEIGVELIVDDILDVTFHSYPAKDVLLLFYACRMADEAQPIRNLEVADHRWVRPRELRGYELPPPDERVIAKLERRAPEQVDDEI